MLNIRWYAIAIIFCHSILESAYGQNIIGNNCTSEVSGSQGKCELLTKCKKIRDELVNFNRLPQTCGFQETQPIVCCPNGSREPGDISKKRCQEYSSLKSGHKIVKRIVHGVKASRKEFTHMALLGVNKKSSQIHWTCGGTIISEKYILTAAQCLKDEVKFVRVGFTNVDDPEHRQEIKVLETIAHPDRKVPMVYNDVGLVKLEKPIEFNSYASPACLFTSFQVPSKKAIITGWGFDSITKYTYKTLPASSKDLLKATLPLVDSEFCNREWKKVADESVLGRGIVDEEQICVGTDNKWTDRCDGDTGGPLQIHDSDLGMYKVIGIISFGSFHCSAGYPAVCTRVSHYIKWIEDIVWPEL